MGVELDRALARLAGTQDNVVTRRQLLELGFTEAEVDRMSRTERLHPVHRGVYHVGHASLSDRARHRAALFAVGDAAVISHRSAADLWGLLAWDGYPELTTTLRSQNRLAGLIVHRVRRALPSTERRGFRITTVEQTILDLATIPPAEGAGSRAGRGRIPAPAR